jgi:transcriptional regulator with XRE-family HTH domain
MAFEDEFYKRFGRRLARLRKKAAVSQQSLAGCVGLSRTSITNIERGRQPVQVHTLYAIANALGIEVPDLLPAVPKGVGFLPGIADRLEQLTPNEKGQLEQLGIREKEWLEQIARPKAKK